VNAQGAIIAQVAISAISLTGLEDSHWLVEAFFIASLVTGCLSVFFSCAIGPAFHGLHSAEDIKNFLTKPTPAAEAKELYQKLSEAEKFKVAHKVTDGEQVAQLDYMLKMRKWKVASAYATILLVVPKTLLSVALNTFLVGLGIYMGMLYTAKLVPTYGSGSIGILVFYLVSAFVGIGMYYLANTLKYLEGTPLLRFRKIADPRGMQRASKLESGSSSDGNENTRRTLGPRHFQQSRHLRLGSRIQYTDDAAIVVVDAPVDQDEQFGKDADTLPEGGPAEGGNVGDSPTISHTSDQYETSATGEQVPHPAIPTYPSGSAQPVAPSAQGLESMQEILQDLLRAHHESLRINQRLLEALDSRLMRS